MPPKPEEAPPSGLWYFIGRATNYAVPFLIAFEVWQSKEIAALRETDVKIQEWRNGIGDRMKIETEKLRLEILSSVAATVGVNLVEIQKSQIRLEISMEELKRRLDAASVATTK